MVHFFTLNTLGAEMPEPTDRGLLIRMQSGDDDAQFEFFWQRYDALHGFISAKLPARIRATVDPDDILQDVFAAAYGNIHRFELREEHSVDKWLQTIAVRKLIDQVRQYRSARQGGKMKFHRIEQPDENGFQFILEGLTENARSPSSYVAAGEATAAVRSAIDELNGKRQQAIQLRFLHGLSLNDTAHQMGMTRGAVSMTVKRAIEELRQRLGRRSRHMER